MGLLAERYGSYTGRLVHDDPLPVGRYWIDIFEKGLPAWVQWSAAHVQSLNIEKTQFFAGGTEWTIQSNPYWIPGLPMYIPGTATVPDRTFIIFRVNAPVPWGIATDVGWPNTAPASIQSSQDTSTAQDVIDQANKDDEDKWKWVKYGAIGLIGVVGLYSIAKLVRG